mmetsp:Transcript_60181/g.142472  ORF Transcript_60181/g.142472 Transcript_60181/m.142472 type:complete len:277 (-) Transcript_60181:85-915(-)
MATPGMATPGMATPGMAPTRRTPSPPPGMRGTPSPPARRTPTPTQATRTHATRGMIPTRTPMARTRTPRRTPPTPTRGFVPTRTPAMVSTSSPSPTPTPPSPPRMALTRTRGFVPTRGPPSADTSADVTARRQSLSRGTPPRTSQAMSQWQRLEVMTRARRDASMPTETAQNRGNQHRERATAMALQRRAEAEVAKLTGGDMGGEATASESGTMWVTEHGRSPNAPGRAHTRSPSPYALPMSSPPPAQATTPRWGSPDHTPSPPIHGDVDPNLMLT